MNSHVGISIILITYQHLSIEAILWPTFNSTYGFRLQERLWCDKFKQKPETPCVSFDHSLCGNVHIIRTSIKPKKGIVALKTMAIARSACHRRCLSSSIRHLYFLLSIMTLAYWLFLLHNWINWRSYKWINESYSGLQQGHCSRSYEVSLTWASPQWQSDTR